MTWDDRGEIDMHNANNKNSMATSLFLTTLYIGLAGTQFWIGTLQSRLTKAEDACRAAHHASIWQAGDLAYCRKELASSAFVIKGLEERLRAVESCMVCELPEAVVADKPEEKPAKVTWRKAKTILPDVD